MSEMEQQSERWFWDSSNGVHFIVDAEGFLITKVGTLKAAKEIVRQHNNAIERVAA